jgi:SnoaL-like domain
MSRPPKRVYNIGMSTTQPTANPHFAIAGVLVEALAAHDFDGIAAALEPDATMAALLPGRNGSWEGAADVCRAFATWFGDVDEFEVADVSVGQVGELLQLRWRVRVRGIRFGAEPMIAEQSAYASTGPNGRIDRIRLLCSGFWSERGTA